MWNYFGAPSLFFTISPCNEVSFRMKLYATADTHKLPSLEWSDEECLAEWRVRSNLRSKYPGAGAIEFQNFTQIMLEDCLGWDIKKTKESVKECLETWRHMVEQLRSKKDVLCTYTLYCGY